MSDANENDGDDEDDDGSEIMDPSLLKKDYIIPLKDVDEADSGIMSEASLSVNGQDGPKLDFGESLTRGGKLRKLAPPLVKRRKTPHTLGRSRTPRAPSPIIPPRSTSPWPEIQNSDIRDTDHHSTKRRRTSARHETNTNGTKESTPLPPSSRGSRRAGKDDPVISAEERIKRSKRVKISPRKEKQQPNRQRSPPHPLTGAHIREENSGAGTPRFVVNMKPSEKEDADPTRYNEEICSSCGGPGRFLCCEGCPKSFHFTCLDPPIDENELPEDSWYVPPMGC
jgi:hypothetical protein